MTESKVFAVANDSSKASKGDILTLLRRQPSVLDKADSMWGYCLVHLPTTLEVYIYWIVAIRFFPSFAEEWW